MHYRPLSELQMQGGDCSLNRISGNIVAYYSNLGVLARKKAEVVGSGLFNGS